MTGRVDRKHVFEAAERLGWVIDESPNGKGYLKMWCPCGNHMRWLHKTPSNPSYYRQTIGYMERVCGQSAE